MSDKILFRTGAAIVAMYLLSATALAVDTMADWTGQNSNPGNTTFTVVTTANDYGLISNTSVGGTIQSKINFSSPIDPSVTVVNAHNVYFSDPTLEGPTLDFTTPLHMEGTITFNSPTDTEPNILFGWYSSEDTTHRIGLGISNRAAGTPGGAIANHLRIDFGYASTPYPNPNPPPTNLGNKFYYVSTDGNQPADSVNSVVPNGTYPFTFDYVPGNLGVTGGGSISATVGTFFKTVQPLETDPEDNDFFMFDRFGFVQRSTTNSTNNPLNTYSVTFSNVDYSGGTAAAVTIPGDFDGDLDVDATDLGIWETNFGTGTTVATGDADNDGDADGNDFLIWQQNLSIAPVAAVPEPSAAILLGLGLAGVLRRRQLRL